MPSKNLHTRRQWLAQSSMATLFGGIGIGGLAAAENATAKNDDPVPGPDYRIQHGRAKQSVMAWCFQPN